jgi:hypothetical protein
VQTETYKEAVVGIKVAIMHRLHPDVNLDQAQIDTIQEKLLQAIDANPLEKAPPQFLYSKFAQVNLHHSKVASAALCVAMKNCDVALI